MREFFAPKRGSGGTTLSRGLDIAIALAIPFVDAFVVRPWTKANPGIAGRAAIAGFFAAIAILTAIVAKLARPKPIED